MTKPFAASLAVVASVTMLLAVRSAVIAQAPTKAQAAFKAAMDKETVEGDLKGAIEQYKKLAQSSDRALAARALIQMAGCYQKLGDAEARKIYEQIVRDYGDQREAVTIARARLGAASATAARAGMESQWRAAAQTAWAKAGRPDTEEAFCQQFLARVAQLYPSEEHLRRKFDFFWLSYQLSLTGLREVSAARMAAEEEQRRQADEAYRLEVQQRLAETLDRSIGELHAQIAHTFERVLEHVKSGRPLRDGSLGRLRQSIERFRKLNVFGDSTLEQTIARFEQTCLHELDTATVSSSPDLRQVFQQGLESVLAAATAGGEVSALTGRLRRQFDLGDDGPTDDSDTHEEDEAAVASPGSA